MEFDLKLFGISGPGIDQFIHFPLMSGFNYECTNIILEANKAGQIYQPGASEMAKWRNSEIAKFNL